VDFNCLGRPKKINKAEFIFLTGVGAMAAANVAEDGAFEI
jgi:hypothetical protein